MTISEWVLDSSTFISGLATSRTWILTRLGRSLTIPEYVFRFELGLRARPETRKEAQSFVERGHARLASLTLEDLDQLAAMEVPRRIGIGEAICAVLALRGSAGVLSDDLKAKRWLTSRLTVIAWETVEDLLLEAATRSLISEYDLEDCQQRLAAARYTCHFNLREEFLRRALNQ